MPSPTTPIPLRTRLSFAASGMGMGIVSTGLTFFLLIYYSQVLGMDPALAGLAMMISLVIDAVSDPVVGRWSDRLQSRYGRRHPFLFASIIPVTLLYYLLWNPPSLSQMELFAYLVTLTVTLRFAYTLHSVPFNALLPELTPDYDQRTRLMSYSHASQWFFGTAFAMMMYVYWLADAPGAPYGSGVLRATGYEDAGATIAVLILIGFSFAAFATMKSITTLSTAPDKAASLAEVWREARITLNDRNFIVLVVSGVASAAAWGTGSALWAYMQPYFWGFDSDQTSVILAAQLLSPLFGFALGSAVIEGRDKKASAIHLSLASIAVSSLPVFLHLQGWFPKTGEPTLFYTMVTLGVIQITFNVIAGAVTASMLADIVESRAVATGRREEGLLFSVLSFIGKVASGLGVWVSGLVLAFIEFPTDTAATSVSPEVVARLGWLYGPIVGLLYLLAIGALVFYQLDRKTHEANLLQSQKT